MSSNEKKAATLGMPHGTATGKLRKNIMFLLLCRLEENDCYRCKKKISTVDELSVEHIKPWEGVSAELFWDLQNIAFSHVVCNRPHRNGGIDNRIDCPVGTSWRYRCRSFLSTDRFYKLASRYNGLAKECVACKSKIDARVNHAKKVYVPM